MKAHFFILAALAIIITCISAKADQENSLKQNFKISDYSSYLEKSLETLKYDDPDTALEERHIKAIPSSNIYYYPESFYISAIANGGMVPIMLYNAENFLVTMTQDQYEMKLKNWESIKNKYNAIFHDDKNFTAEYDRWKSSSPAFLSLSEDQKKALYALSLFKKKYITYDADTAFSESISAPSDTNKIYGDCDGLSYVFAAILIDATDNDGKKIFSLGEIKFDVFEGKAKKGEEAINHIRMRIKTNSKEDIIFESTNGTAFGENSQKTYSKNIDPDDFKRTFSVVEALGYNLFSERNNGTKLLQPEAMAFTRSIYMVNNGNKLLRKNFDSQREFIENTAYNEVIDLINSLVAERNKAESIDQEKFTTAFDSIMKLRDTYGANRDAKLKQFLATLKDIDPKEYEKLYESRKK